MSGTADKVRARNVHNQATAAEFKTAPAWLCPRLRGSDVEGEHEIAGWRECISIPDWGIEGLVAKLDSGARSSCIDARGPEIIEGEEHGEVRFTVPTLQGDVVRQEPILDWRFVRDSGGHTSLRPVIAVRMKLGPMEWVDEATLSDRSDMSHRVLIGRRVTAHRFLIDPANGFRLTPEPQGANATTDDGVEESD